MADAESDRSNEHFNNRIALTIALLATFLALSAIKGGNVDQAIAQAQAERNNSWAWYQAVRVREDMATYELAHLQRLARTLDRQRPADAAEAERLATDVRTQEGEVANVRARKDEVQQRALDAEAQLASLNVIADQYDFSDALLAIAMSLLAVCALARVRWLYWFALIPTLAGLGWGGASMFNIALPAQHLLAWLN
ncbi:MAG: DUF4337 domain-containing protein [Hyphomonadaceae bacterium]|nr:DUF4337 domain-containing protein [Hyphomonadaceae bacterium]